MNSRLLRRDWMRIDGLGLLACFSLVGTASVVPIPAAAQQLTLVSRAADGGAANAPTGASIQSRNLISGNGRFVAFDSVATNLMPGPVPPGGVYVRDLEAGTTSLVSVGSGGESIAPSRASVQAISADGRFVLFRTDASLSPDDTDDTECHAVFGLQVTPVPCADLYLRDRETNQTTLISQQIAGLARPDVTSGSMSADGRFIVFSAADTTRTPTSFSQTGPVNAFLHDRATSTTTMLDVPPAPLGSRGLQVGINGDGGTIFATRGNCSVQLACDVAKLIDRVTGAAHNIQMPQLPVFGSIQNASQEIRFHGVSASGRYALLSRLVGGGGGQVGGGGLSLMLYDRQDARFIVSITLPTHHTHFNEHVTAALAGDGRGFYYKLPSSAPGADAQLLYFDIQTHQATLVLRVSSPGRDVGIVATSADASRVVFSGIGAIAAGVPGEQMQVYTFIADSDADGMSDAWETAFGLNPADASDADADPDGDGYSNLQEYQRGRHPSATHTRYLAEGSSNLVFGSRIGLVNPNDTPAAVVIRYLAPDGTVIPSQSLIMPPLTRRTITREMLPLNPTSDFSTVVESDVRVVAARTFGVSFVGHGTSGETAIVAPSTTWLFAEGATGGPFSLFYLLQNPGDAPADVSITYLLPAPEAPLTKTYTLAPHSRRTIWVDEEDPRLSANNVSASITSNHPIVAERSLYLASLGEPFGALAGGAGVTAPATRWFLAEGATGPFFDMYVLLANPGTTATDVTLKYLLPDGTNFTKTYPLAGQSRQTILVDAEDPRLDNSPVSIVVESTSGVPIVAERAMWWPQGNWYEGHSSVATTVTSRRWVVAEGQAVLNHSRTYIMIANVSDVPGTATVTFLAEADQTPATRQFNLPANSRTTFLMDWDAGLEMFDLFFPQNFGAIVSSPDVDLVVEYAIYRDNGAGIPWTGGTVALGEPIP